MIGYDSGSATSTKFIRTRADRFKEIMGSVGLGAIDEVTVGDVRRLTGARSYAQAPVFAIMKGTRAGEAEIATLVGTDRPEWLVGRILHRIRRSEGKPSFEGFTVIIAVGGSGHATQFITDCP